MPLPIMDGAVVRRVVLHYTDGVKSNKDYGVTITEAGGSFNVYTTHGPHGRMNQGDLIAQFLPSLGVAERLANPIIDKKQNQKQAYRIVSDERFPVSGAAPKTKAPVAPPVLTAEAPKSTTLGAKSRAVLSRMF